MESKQSKAKPGTANMSSSRGGRFSRTIAFSGGVSGGGIYHGSRRRNNPLCVSQDTTHFDSIVGGGSPPN